MQGANKPLAFRPGAGSNFFEKGLDKLGGMCYYIYVKGRDNTLRGLDLRVGTGNDPQKLGREKKSQKK